MKNNWDYCRSFIELALDNTVSYYEIDSDNNINLFLKDKKNNKWVKIIKYKDKFINIATYDELPLEYKSCENVTKIILAMKGVNKIG